MTDYNFHTGGYCPGCLHEIGKCVCAQRLWETLKKQIMDEKLKNVDLIVELEDTFAEVGDQLAMDEKRYGDTWKERGLVFNGQSQEERFFQKMQEYVDDYRENGTPMPWLKIIGEAHIALVREKKLK